MLNYTPNLPTWLFDSRKFGAGPPKYWIILEHINEHAKGETAKTFVIMVLFRPKSALLRSSALSRRCNPAAPNECAIVDTLAETPHFKTWERSSICWRTSAFFQAASRPTFPSNINSCSFWLKTILFGILLKICWTSSGPSYFPPVAKCIAVSLRWPCSLGKGFWAIPKRCASANSAICSFHRGCSHPVHSMEGLRWKNMVSCIHTHTGWLVVWTPLKNMSQLGWLFPIYGKNVPNHQPAGCGILVIGSMSPSGFAPQMPACWLTAKAQIQ